MSFEYCYRYRIFRLLHPKAAYRFFALWNQTRIREFTENTGLDKTNIRPGRLESNRQQKDYNLWLYRRSFMI